MAGHGVVNGDEKSLLGGLAVSSKKQVSAIVGEMKIVTSEKEAGRIFKQDGFGGSRDRPDGDSVA